MANKVKIGALNLMHDKLDTQKRFLKVLPNEKLTFLFHALIICIALFLLNYLLLLQSH